MTCHKMSMSHSLHNVQVSNLKIVKEALYQAVKIN